MTIMLEVKPIQKAPRRRLVQMASIVILICHQFSTLMHKITHAGLAEEQRTLDDASDLSYDVSQEEPPDALLNLIDLKTNNPVPLKKHSVNFNSGNHLGNKSDVKSLLQIQTHMYDTLTRWNHLAEDLGTMRWVAHGGSAIGAKCFGAMNPWDDDIDFTVLDCKSLDQMWEKGERNITTHYPTLDERSYWMDNGAALWDPRLIKVAGEDMILTKGSRCCNWYKLMTMKLAFSWKPGDPIYGIDIECMSRSSSSREKVAMRRSGWTEHMKSTQELATVPFGPTTIKAMEPNTLNSYIRLRYGKESPCQYPFANGADVEKFPPALALHHGNHSKTAVGTSSPVQQVFRLDQDQAHMGFVLENWYVSKSQRDEWLERKGNKKQMEYTQQLANIDKIEIDNTISPTGCTWQSKATGTPNIKVIGWNAERGVHWDKFYKLIQEKEELSEPVVILLNEMDIGMARSGNLHTARRLALQLGMNYAYGVEFLELTRGTKEEQEATKGKRDALGLHGNAILSKCILGDAMILRDPLPHQYFSDKPERGFNANGFEVRLGGRMGLFARIFEKPSPLIPNTHNVTAENSHIPEKLPGHFVVGNIHKVGENAKTRKALWNYYGFGPPAANSTSIYDGKGVDLASSQHGVVVQGDFGPSFCALGGLGKMNNYRIHKTFRVKCLPDRNVKIAPLAGDFFCSNMRATRDVMVTPPCDWSNNSNPLTMADHAIVSIEVSSNKHE